MIQSSPRRIVIGLFLILLLPVLTSRRAVSQDLLAEVEKLASQSVVRVDARECISGRDVQGSGFLRGKPDQVVTALHVVAGCEAISVYFETVKIVRSAKLQRVSKEADLGLLRVTNPPNLPVLQPSSSMPKLTDDLFVLGYPKGLPSLNSMNLQASFGLERQLSAMLPDPNRRDVQKAGMPSLELEVLRIQGHLLPGHSGAPIFNRSGRVVAVADGGLDGGSIEIGWGVPVDNVGSLMTSRQAVTEKMAATVTVLFSAELDSKPEGTITCGALGLTKLRTRSFDQLMRSLDPEEAKRWGILDSVAKYVQPDTSRLLFDIYVHLQSGATVVIPQGLPGRRSTPFSLVQTPDDCLVKADGFEMRIAGYHSPEDNLAEAELKLKTRLYDPSSLSWKLAPTDNAPDVRFDGQKVTDKRYDGFDYQGVKRQLSSVTFVQRGEILLAIVLLNPNVGPPTPSLAFPERRLPPGVHPGVSPSPAPPSRIWMTMALGAALSRFAIG